MVLTKIHSLLNAEMKAHGWPVTFSIGAVTYLRPLESTHEMIREADQTMYSAKAAGKNRIVQTTRPAALPLPQVSVPRL
jgi:PleD family two-component response regulator